MRSSVSKFLLVVLVVAMTSVVALAKKERKTVSLPADMKINGTVVKKGTYDVVFDRDGGQLSVLKNGKVVATTTARVEARDRKARTTEVVSLNGNDGRSLLRIAFGGSKENIVIAQSGVQSAGTQ
ncbi:MAG TPA: hypothetical protein VJ124_24005 [Pyrinomonadaceae bacterium]|nr:hypothetical protein [Pyrinomonadaceae bacterium]